ncbi:hypothetical protein Taro_029407 [Colocasia esculenta]|uniref:Uncharacterized protein n=1 Tax=Colocasia esculenta TaxID=4460 RepID=A0A843W068_COLES|nr:hypothetical protein [Colocasia esculenta]
MWLLQWSVSSVVSMGVCGGFVGGGATFRGHWRGSGRSGRYSGIRAQGSNVICNELITMAIPKKGTRAMLARLCIVAFRSAIGSLLQVASFLAESECELQEIVAAVAECACFECGFCFARAAIGFVFGLRVCMGVFRRLRKPTCGVAFTSAGLWTAELVEGVLALLAVPFLLGCVLVGCPLIVGVCVWPCVLVHRWALCSAQSSSLLKLSRCLCAVLHRWLSAVTPVCGCCRLCAGSLRTLVRCSRSSSLLVLVERFVVRVSFPCFSLVAQGGGAGATVGVVSRTVVTFVVKAPPLVLS